MSRTSTAPRGAQKSVFGSLLAPVVFVAVAGLVGWLLLITVKWLVVTLLVAIGIALIIVPFAAGRRIIGAAVGSERTHRIGQLAIAVALGIALIAVAIVVAHHGWLLIVVPVVVVLIGRLMSKFNEARVTRRNRSYS